MIRALLAASFFFAFAVPALAQTPTLSLIRAVRVSTTSVSISFKTSELATGRVAYTDADGSTFTLTDSVSQVDHLFTMKELSPTHGYSFALSASTSAGSSNTYTVLLSPESIGAPGESFMPSVQVTDDKGNIVGAVSGASSTPPAHKPIAPWWAFAIAFIVFVVVWIASWWLKR